MAAQMLTLTLVADVAPLHSALREFAEILERAREVGERALGLLEPIAQAAGFDVHGLVATRTVDNRIVFEPSDRFRELLAAARACEVERLGVENVQGGSHAG